jgi:hypothetical protein
MPYRISGHETFACRYTWLPKVVRYLAADSRLLAKEDEAMVRFGVGKNMVRSIRFWALATGIVTSAGRDGTLRLTDFGRVLLGTRGLDPFLEDIRTLWLIHWQLATNTENPLLAWDYLLNRWHEPELSPSKAAHALEKEAGKENDRVSPVTVAQHFEVFLHTYFPTRGRKAEVQEDNLDCPLVELALLVKVGERDPHETGGRREPIYAFHREEKPEITPELFLYCLNSFLQERHSIDGTVPFSEIAHGHGSPGQIFKLPEDDVRARLDLLDRLTNGAFTYTESTNLPQVQTHASQDGTRLLKRIYQTDGLQ